MKFEFPKKRVFAAPKQSLMFTNTIQAGERRIKTQNCIKNSFRHVVEFIFKPQQQVLPLRGCAKFVLDERRRKRKTAKIVGKQDFALATALVVTTKSA